MPPKSLNTNSKTKLKNDYVRELIDSLQKLNTGILDGVDIKLESVSLSQALKLIQQNIQDKKLAFVLENNK
jgi:hypothetical protein